MASDNRITLDRALIAKLPKTDLHLHLDGSLRPETLIELARERKVELPSYTVEGLHDLVFKERYADLGEYLHGFSYTTPILQDHEALERIAYELAVDNQNEGVRYIEVRYAPQLHSHVDLPMEEVLLAVHRGLKRAQEEFNARPQVRDHSEPAFHYGIIVCALRFFTGKFSRLYDHFWKAHEYAEPHRVHALACLELAQAATAIRVKHPEIPLVGFDLAGQEKGHPARDYREGYQHAHENFFGKTVHAGEAYGPESIFQALTDLHADRIGHGTWLFETDRIDARKIQDPDAYVKNLVHFIADRRITLEICLTSNLQTSPTMENLSEHPFGRMLQEKLSTTICTDNRLVSRTTVTDEIVKAVEAFDIDLHTLRDLVIYGFKRSFFPGTYIEKRAYVREIINYFEKVAENSDA